MFKFVAFKTQKPRSFNYKPLYYSPEKEAREERRKELLSQRGIFEDDSKTGGKDSNEYRPGQYIASKRQSRVESSYDKSRGNSSKIRLLALVVIVCLLGYWIFLM